MRIFLVGAGEVGFHIATSLAREGHDLVVIEADAAQAQKVQAELDAVEYRVAPVATARLLVG